MPVAAAGLEQQHAMARILRQPVGEHAARRPSADDDVRVAVHRRFSPQLRFAAARTAIAGAAACIASSGRRPSWTAWQATSPPPGSATARGRSAGSARWRRAARMEGAARRRVERVRHLARDRRARLAAHRPDPGWRRAACAYRDGAAGRTASGRRELDQPAEIHHADPVGDLVDHREVVRDEQVGEARAAPAGPSSGSGSAPAPRRRAPRSARRRRGTPARPPARARSRCAGAARRRTRAGISRRRPAARPTCASSSPTRVAGSPGRSSECRGADRLGDDVAYPPARIEAGVGVLEDHLHPAPQPAERAARALPSRRRRSDLAARRR